MTVELAHPSTEPEGLVEPAQPTHPYWSFLRTTPGRILTLGIVLGALGLASAFATATTVNNRQHTLTAVLNHAEPLAASAGQLYTALSVADAAAATAFIAQAEPPKVRNRYEQAIIDAADGVTRASSGLTDANLVSLLGRINAELTVYTGLVEIARTNNRAGNPVGASYLAEASSLMQDTILPDAQQLYSDTAARVDAETTSSARLPAPVLLTVFLTVAFGVFVHRWLARRTRRRINPGLVVGGLAIMLMMIWVGTALTISTTSSRIAKNTAADSLKTLTNLSILAQQARAEETLSLLRRGGEAAPKRTFYEQIDAMQGQLNTYLANDRSTDKSALADADELLDRWRNANYRINQYIAVGNYQAATQVAVGTGEGDSTPAFEKLGTALSQAMDDSRTQLRTEITNARRGLSGATVGSLVLSIAAAMAVALGMWPRLSEYR